VSTWRSRSWCALLDPCDAIQLRIQSSHHPALNSPRAVPPLQAHFKTWSFPKHGLTRGEDRDLKAILKRRHTSGRRTSGKKMYKRFSVAEADLSDEAKRLVNRGLHLNIDTEGEAKFTEEALKIKAEECDRKRKLEEEAPPPEDDDSDAQICPNSSDDDDIPLIERAAAKAAKENQVSAC
jgi:hypothetical protein